LLDVVKDDDGVCERVSVKDLDDVTEPLTVVVLEI
jgi:hypothetical protein